MQNKLFLKAADICELLEVKQTSAYEIIGNLNKELEEQGYLTLRGKVPTKYFVKRFYGVEDTCEIPQEEGKGMVSCVREKCIYQWKTLPNSLSYQFLLLTGWWKE